MSLQNTDSNDEEKNQKNGGQQTPDSGPASAPPQTSNYATRPGTGKTDFDAVNNPKPETFGQNNLANRPVTPVGSPVTGGGIQTGNGSRIPQSPMNPNPGYATRPGTGKTDFDAVNNPKPETFGQNSLANRPVRQVGRSMNDPQRQAEMARRRAVANGDLDGAAKIVMGQQPQQNPGAAAAPQVAGGVQTGNGSRIPQSPMNPNPGYATRPGIGKTDFDAINNPKPETFGQNSLANRPVRQVGRSMMDPQRQAEMARRRAVANGGMSDEGEDDEVPGRAKGGPVKAGKPYLVGEEGPEIIVPKESGTVVPNHAISAAALKAAKGACAHSRARILTPRQTPAEAYAQLRKHKDSGAANQGSQKPDDKGDSARRPANVRGSRLFEARKTPANAVFYL